MGQLSHRAGAWVRRRTPIATYSVVFWEGTCLGRRRSARVFLSGLIFLILTLTKIREHIVNDIPDSLKHGTAAGIGLFIAFIGMKNAQLIVPNSATIVGIGKITDPPVLLALLGLVVIVILMAKRVTGAILIGIVGITLLGIPLKLATWPSHFLSLPHPGGTFLKLDLRSATHLGLGELIFVFFFVDLFDNVGTLVGVCEQGSFMRDGKFPRASQALLADAFGTIAGALTGTSTVTSYVESAAGVAAGARTGLGNVLMAVLFSAAMFCAPIVTCDFLPMRRLPRWILVGALMVYLHRQNSLGRFDGRLPRLHDDGGHPPDVQHCHRAQPRPALLHVRQVGHRAAPRDQPADLDFVGAFPHAVRVSRKRVNSSLCVTVALASGPKFPQAPRTLWVGEGPSKSTIMLNSLAPSAGHSR